MDRSKRAGSLVVAVLVAACGQASPSSPSGLSSPPSIPSAATATALTATATVIPRPSPVVARDAEVVGPTGLLFDAAGNLFVSGCSSTRSYIYRIDPAGLMTTVGGTGPTFFLGDGGPATSAQLQCPVGMAFGPDRALYFADHASNRIRRIDGAGLIMTVAGSGAAGVDLGSFTGDGGPATSATLQEPWAVAFDRDGNLFIGDRGNFRVRRVDPHGVITTVAGNGDPGFSGDGGPATNAGMCPHGVAFDPAGDLLIAEPCNNRIRKVDSHGMIRTFAGTGAAGFAGDGGSAALAVIDTPDFLAFDGHGDLFIQAGSRIRRIDAAGVIATVAGNGTAGVPVDGTTALQSPMPDLYGVAVDAAGNVYLADGETSLYRIDAKGIITRFAGKPA